MGGDEPIFPHNSDMLSWALSYAKAGLPVLPLHTVTRTETSDPVCSCGNTRDCKTDKKQRGKHPRTEHGSRDATTDPEVITEWWTRWPDANIGILTGNGIVVVDDDRANPNVAFPSTIAQRTGRGHQYFYRADSTSIPGRTSVLEGVDLRSDGNYVVVPPSIHWTGRRYTWQRRGEDIDVVPDFATEITRPAPEFWEQMLSGSFGAPESHNKSTRNNGSKRRKGFKVPDIIADGTRDAVITQMAGQLHAKGWSQEAIVQACLVENQQRCQPPLSPEQVLKCVLSITEGHPGGEMILTLGGLGDDALALKYAELYKDDLRFTASWSKWLAYDGKVWQPDNTLRAFDRARHMLRELVVGHQPADVEKYTSAMTVSAVERLARSDQRLVAVPEQWDSDPWWLNTPGGVVDLRTGELRPHRREDYLTKITAVAPEGECPLWLEFLNLVTSGNVEFQTFLQRLAGYSLTGSTREQALFFFYGPGGNGKTTFLETVAGIMADYSKTASMDTFVVSHGDRHPTELAWLRGARLVTAIESAEGRRFDESRIKQLTGSDKIAARGMRQDFFQYVPQFKLLFASNNKPHLGKVDEALRRRIYIVPFLVHIKPEVRDKDFAQKLKAEWGGILRWMIEGCRDWQEHGLNPPAAISDATQDYLADEDVRGRWIEECCVLGPQCFTPTETLWKNWSLWADVQNEYVGKRNDLLQYLEDERGFKKEKRQSKGDRHWGLAGIGIKDGTSQNSKDWNQYEF